MASAADSPERDGGPRPTAHLNRRDVLKLTGAAGGAAVGGATFGTMPVSASEWTLEACAATVPSYLLTEACSWTMDPLDDDSESVDQATLQTELHSKLRGSMETAEQLFVFHDNYIEDTGTLGSLEARHAIATAYEAGETADTADTQAQEAITDYYAVRQENMVESMRRHLAEVRYVASLLPQSNVYNSFVYMNHADHTYKNASGGSPPAYDVVDAVPTGGSETTTYTLTNGTTIEYETVELEIVQYDDQYDTWYFSNVQLDPLEPDTTQSTYNRQSSTNGRHGDRTDSSKDEIVHEVDWSGRFQFTVAASYKDTQYAIEDGHPAQIVGKFGEWQDRVEEWATQSDTITSNYSAGFAQDLYDALDAGTITPSQLRSAEGQVRFLSGEDETTEHRFKTALIGSLELQNAGFDKTMTVTYSGYTGREFTEEDTDDDGDLERSVIYTDEVTDQTYEGLLFAATTPTDGFQVGETYQTANLDGRIFIQTEDATVPLYDGDLTIESMTDLEGNEVESADWDSPKYGSYDADEYIAYLEETVQMQQDLLERTSEDDGSEDEEDGWGFGLGGWSMEDGSFVGLAIVGGVVALMVGVATDIIPGLGD